jgi:hypothetical protein
MILFDKSTFPFKGADSNELYPNILCGYTDSGEMDSDVSILSMFNVLVM